MSKVAIQPNYDPAKTFDDNFDNGPFGAFANKKQIQPKGEPKYTFLGYPIYSPFGIAAGSLPTSKHVRGAFYQGFDVVCYKTQRTTVILANQFPNVIPIDVVGKVTLFMASRGLFLRDEFNKNPKRLTITNSFGNPSRGPEFWVKDVKKALTYEGKGQLLIVSVCGTIRRDQTQNEYFQDFAEAAKLAANAGAKAIELNLSCPNAASEGVICYTPEAVASIIRRTRKAIGEKKLIIKIGYYSKEQLPLLEQIITENIHRIDAISAINTIPSAIYKKNGTQALPGEGRLKSGLCGAGIKWAGLRMVKRLNTLREAKGYNFEIIGVGGVMDVNDFIEYRKAGADVVQSVTGSMWNPSLASEIKSALK